MPEEWSKNTYNNTVIDSSGIHLTPHNYSIHIVSSGWLTGIYGVVEIDGSNVLSSTFNRGITVVQLDSIDFHVIQMRTFDTYGGSPNGDDTSYAAQLTEFLNALPQGSLMVMVAIDEASHALTTTARNAIKEFGSQYIDNLGWRDPWALFGQKGSAIGTVIEKWLPASDSQRVTIDTNFIKPSLTGELLSESFGPATQWTKATIRSTIPQGARLGLYVLGRNSAGTFDTLIFNDTSKTISLMAVDANKYSSLRLLEKYWANAQGISPVLNDWDVILLPPPDLAINYQCVSTSADSVLEGSPIQITAQIHNIGEQPVNNVKVLSTLMNVGIRQRDTMSISTVPADSFFTLTYPLVTTGRRGTNTIFISIDPQQQIAEVNKINNAYSFSLFVRTDTARPTFDITFDGRRIFDNDYVLAKPTIRVNINDNSPLPITDPSSVNLALDGRRVTLGTSTLDSLFTSQSGNYKAVITYHPILVTGEHVLLVKVMDVSGNYSDSIATQIQFRVETESKLLDVLNYPNPFGTNTYFTFNSVGSEMPEEMVIKIYTLAGRLIRDFHIPPTELLPGFNRVLWDGRDQDGDDIANGVYFYKVIMKIKLKTIEVIQKLAKVR